MTCALALAWAFVGCAPAPALRWPIRCELGSTCWVQNYVDHAADDTAQDYTCGDLTYDGHDGTDIRVRDVAAMRAGVDVLAVAPGTVLRARDGEPERILADGESAPVGRECGNGVVLTHAGGWQTQYCHLAAGSIAVEPGERVAAGDVLGRVGVSGKTQFPHVHLTVRHDGVVVDPFDTGEGADCAGTEPLWAEPAPYRRTDVLAVGLAGSADLRDPTEVAPAPATADGEALVGWGYAIGLRTGDVSTVEVRRPDGTLLAERSSEPRPRPRASEFSFAGKRRGEEVLPAGAWTVRYTVRHDGDIVADRQESVLLAESQGAAR